MKSKHFDPASDAELAQLQQLWPDCEHHAERLAASQVDESRRLDPRRAASRRDRRRLLAAAIVLACVAALVVSIITYNSLAVDWLLQAAVGLLMAIYAVVALAVGLPLLRSLWRPAARPLQAGVMQLLPQVGTFSAAAMLALVIVATSPVGDGYVMTQNYHGRAEAVAIVNQMLSLA